MVVVNIKADVLNLMSVNVTQDIRENTVQQVSIPLPFLQ